MLQEGTNRFSDMGRRRLVSPALAGRSEVNAGENQRQLGRAHFHRYCTVRDRGKLERAFLKSLEARITLPSYLGRYKNGSSPLGAGWRWIVALCYRAGRRFGMIRFG